MRTKPVNMAGPPSGHAAAVPTAFPAQFAPAGQKLSDLCREHRSETKILEELINYYLTEIKNLKSQISLKEISKQVNDIIDFFNFHKDD